MAGAFGRAKDAFLINCRSFDQLFQRAVEIEIRQPGMQVAEKIKYC
jgi:hypothetical protein